jgi:glycosyltransferase involved in cell wall biosynthesis
LNLFQHAYPGAIVGPEAKMVEDFLIHQDVQTVLAEFGPTGCALAPLCEKLGLRLVVHFHGYDATVMPKRWVIRHAYRNLNKHADAFICASKYFSKKLIKLEFASEKIHIIPYGIEVNKFEINVEKDPNFVLAVGRFVAKKAPHLTLRAFERVLNAFPHARLEMIGDGPLFDRCEEIIAAKGLKDSVILHGAQPHHVVKRKLAEASLFVQHSVTAPNGDTESLGVSVLEAMVSQVPVVVTRHNGFVETVVDGETGFLVEEHDVAAMADRMIQLLQDQQLRHRMGVAGRKRVIEHYEAGRKIMSLRELLSIKCHQ